MRQEYQDIDAMRPVRHLLAVTVADIERCLLGSRNFGGLVEAAHASGDPDLSGGLASLSSSRLDTPRERNVLYDKSAEICNRIRHMLPAG